MQLSLSVRVAESFRNKRNLTIALPELAEIAQNAGYRALCMRASGVGTHSPPERIIEVQHILKKHNLAVSMATGDFAIPENGSNGPESLRNITPHLDLADALGCNLLRVCIKINADIAHAQRAADEAAERDIRLAHQSHTQSLFETVADRSRHFRALTDRILALFTNRPIWLCAVKTTVPIPSNALHPIF